MSTAFLCAMLFVWGVWPAMLSVGIASLAADLRARKQWWKVLFNPAQYALSVGAAYLAIYFIHGPVSLDHSLPRLDRDDLRLDPAGLGRLLRRQHAHRRLRAQLHADRSRDPARRLRPRHPDVVLGHGDLADHRRRRACTRGSSCPCC